MISDMEHIANQAADIVEIVKTMHDKDVNIYSSVHIKYMSKEAIKMVTESVHSFVKIWSLQKKPLYMMML